MSYEDLVKKYQLNPDLKIAAGNMLITNKNELIIDNSMITNVQTLDESPFAEPKISHLPGEKMVYITLKQ